MTPTKLLSTSKNHTKDSLTKAEMSLDNIIKKRYPSVSYTHLRAHDTS